MYIIYIYIYLSDSWESQFVPAYLYLCIVNHFIAEDVALLIIKNPHNQCDCTSEQVSTVGLFRLLSFLRFVTREHNSSIVGVVG